MIEFHVIGCGNSGSIKNWHSSLLLTIGKKNILLDAGASTQWALHEQKLKISDIQAVYVSHLHGDHTHGIEQLGFGTIFSPPYMKPKISLYGNELLLMELWDKSMKGSMECLDISQVPRGQGLPTLDTYFKVHRIADNETFKIGSASFLPIQVTHVQNIGIYNRCFGLLIETKKTRVLWTSDTQFAPNQLIHAYNIADLIIHDCETTKFKSPVHAHYTDLVNLSDDIKAKMWLTHYHDEADQDPVKDGFRGFLKKGQKFYVE